MGSKEGDLAAAVLSYAVDCVAEGDQDRLREIGLEDDDIALLRSLTLEEGRRAGMLVAHGLRIRLDRRIFRVVVGHLKEAQADDDIQYELIRADAPRDMMRRLFGMGAREYAHLRRVLAVETGVGRPATLAEEQEHQLWHAMADLLQPEPDRPLAPEQFLELHAQTGIPLRAIWTHARRWTASPATKIRR